jgi:hypothetical protein
LESVGARTGAAHDAPFAEPGGVKHVPQRAAVPFGFRHVDARSPWPDTGLARR